MNTYFCTEGQSFSDVCLATYKTLDKYGKLLNDNNLAPDSVPSTAQQVLWGDEATVEATVSSTGITFSPTSYNTAPAVISDNAKSIEVIQFTTTAAKTSYSIADVPDLAKIRNKKIFFAEMDNTRLYGDFKSWNDSAFEIVGIEVAGGEEVTILAK